MKKLMTLITAALCLCAVCILGAVPAHALEYSFSAPGSPVYGKPTSIGPVITAGGWGMGNVDLSRNTVLIPPGFGTPASYLPWSGAHLAPNLAPGVLSGGLVNQTGGTGIPDSDYPTVDTGAFGTGGSYVGFTEVTSSMYYSNGSLGTLRIPSIGLTVGIYEGTGDAPLLKGAGHFEGTSIWDGNVAVAGHNRGVRNDFGKIHTLNTGDIITLTTVYGTRTYAVTGVSKVSVNDVSGLLPSGVNMISLYTCVEDQPAYRWRVTAVELRTV